MPPTGAIGSGCAERAPRRPGNYPRPQGIAGEVPRGELPKCRRRPAGRRFGPAPAASLAHRFCMRKRAIVSTLPPPAWPSSPVSRRRRRSTFQARIRTRPTTAPRESPTTARSSATRRTSGDPFPWYGAREPTPARRPFCRLSRSAPRAANSAGFPRRIASRRRCRASHDRLRRQRPRAGGVGSFRFFRLPRRLRASPSRLGRLRIASLGRLGQWLPIRRTKRPRSRRRALARIAGKFLLCSALPLPGDAVGASLATSLSHDGARAVGHYETAPGSQAVVRTENASAYAAAKLQMRVGGLRSFAEAISRDETLAVGAADDGTRLRPVI